LKNIPTWLPVVAAAFCDENDRWLMHKRPPNKAHAGLWEFPGGKVEEAEVPENALFREIREELGVTIVSENCTPLGFAQEPSQESTTPIVILLYKVTAWEGELAALEGGEVGWFSPQEVLKLAKPPLDCALADQLFTKVAN